MSNFWLTIPKKESLVSHIVLKEKINKKLLIGFYLINSLPINTVWFFKNPRDI